MKAYVNKQYGKNITSTLRMCLLVLFAIAFINLANTSLAHSQNQHWAQNDPTSKQQVDHSIWGQILGQYVETDKEGQNLFNYAAVSPADKRALKFYIETISKLEVTKLNRKEQLALWINLYNAILVDIILDTEPVNSILHIKGDLFTRGPWKVKRVTIEGFPLALTDIRNGIVYKNWNDIRTIYTMSCGAVGCPNIGSKAVKGKNVEGYMEAATLAFINGPKAILSIDGDGVRVSKLYYWAKRDFRKNKINILKHIKSYAVGARARKLEKTKHISGHFFNWDINSVNK